MEKCQKDIEDAAQGIAHNTTLERDRDARRVPTKKNEALERAAAKSLRLVESRKQARKARAKLLVKCSLTADKKKVKRRTLKELFYHQRCLQKNREEGVYVDAEETIEEQKQSIEWYKRKRRRRVHPIKGWKQRSQWILSSKRELKWQTTRRQWFKSIDHTVTLGKTLRDRQMFSGNVS